MTEEEAKRTIEKSAKLTSIIWENALPDETVESDWIPRPGEEGESASEDGEES